jgi:hypothetical protein
VEPVIAESLNVLVALGQLGVVEKGAVGLYKGAILEPVRLQVVQGNPSVEMILPAVFVAVGRMEPVMPLVTVQLGKDGRQELVALLVVLRPHAVSLTLPVIALVLGQMPVADKEVVL